MLALGVQRVRDHHRVLQFQRGQQRGEAGDLAALVRHLLLCGQRAVLQHRPQHHHRLPGRVSRAPQALAVHGHHPRLVLEDPQQLLQSAWHDRVDHTADRGRARRCHQAEDAAAA